ncbi:MAG: hypothetical protein AAF483_10105 [Planctomycetota bacterium]
MSRIKEFLDAFRDKKNDQQQATLASLEKALADEDLEFPRGEISEGQLPFAEFANWLARRLGKLKKGIQGCWPRYNGNCWMLIREFVPNEHEQLASFYEWYQEFLQITAQKWLTVSIDKIESREENRVERIEVWKCIPDEGFLAYLVFTDGFARLDGYYSSDEDIYEAAMLRFGVGKAAWTSPSTLTNASTLRAKVSIRTR